MRLQTNPLPNLCDADIIPYYWRPLIYWYWKYYWPNDIKTISGITGRLGPIGFAMSFNYAGVFSNGSHWFTVFHYQREWEEMSY